ncbi:glycosyltransferase family 4 protein [Synechococcus lacustris C3-12m-Tous]|uniref:MraY family glycosyltransferase n=1 Tax=Synechococcus lacustris TaxID=2116544 RepID=UPI0020CD286D|nr:glycosyltransferase family 4 protein [Synechococcus lacustris]MCP9926188.1 glycosyltransferase family 4 protein [Synechococcus lacustris C3-12m-Tous]
MLLPVALCLALSAASCWILLQALIPKLSRRLLDQPNARSSHRQPTPRGGGLAFVVVSAGSSLIAFVWAANTISALPQSVLPLVALPLAIIGLLDDRLNLPASWRYGVQLLTACLILWLSPIALPWQLLPLVIVAVTAVINFTNFMDGLDGLVAGCMAVALAAAALQLAAPWPIWALVGSLLGFLIWNWSPAKVFMGDVGSTFLGAVFAGLVLQAPSWPESLALLLVATPLLGDAFLCVPRRLLAGQRVFQAHRLHLFQRLHQVGWPHARVSSLFIGATAVLAIALLWGGLPWLITLAVFELMLGIWLDQRVAVPFAIASRS